ncbi:uncharacterized protein B0T23DRAFT_372782 [Neurospora hispaniola]|uniref:Secreted protein n=1 Tax=Neurospora hispaniola TaxID=588809 RepID=A0AAJ0IC68_9PEZI|nr:hypothetical protein B0T23DRAFT_372782 [Neurospora hispaniola]
MSLSSLSIPLFSIHVVLGNRPWGCRHVNVSGAGRNKLNHRRAKYTSVSSHNARETILIRPSSMVSEKTTKSS